MARLLDINQAATFMSSMLPGLNPKHLLNDLRRSDRVPRYPPPPTITMKGKTFYRPADLVALAEAVREARHRDPKTPALPRDAKPAAVPVSGKLMVVTFGGQVFKIDTGAARNFGKRLIATADAM